MFQKQKKTEYNGRKPKALRLLAMLLCVVSVFAMVPTTAFAAISLVTNETDGNGRYRSVDINLNGYSDEQLTDLYDEVKAIKQDKTIITIGGQKLLYVAAADGFVPMNGGTPWERYQAFTLPGDGNDVIIYVWYGPDGTFCQFQNKFIALVGSTPHINRPDYGWTPVNTNADTQDAADKAVYSLITKMSTYVSESNTYMQAYQANLNAGKENPEEGLTEPANPFEQPIGRDKILSELYVPEEPPVKDPRDMSEAQVEALKRRLDTVSDGDIVDFSLEKYLYVGVARGFILMNAGGTAPANDADRLIVSDGRAYMYDPDGRASSSGYALVTEISKEKKYDAAAGKDKTIFEKNDVKIQKRDINNILYEERLSTTNSAVAVYAKWRTNGTCATVVDIWKIMADAGKPIAKPNGLQDISKGEWVGWVYEAPLEVETEIKRYEDQQYLQPDWKGVNVSDTYLLSVGTGVDSGVNVKYFSVRYVDKNDVIRTEFIFPNEGDLGKSYSTVLETVGGGKQYEAAATSAKNGLGYIFTEPTNVSALRSYTTDEYLFKPSYQMKQLMGVDVFMRYPYHDNPFTDEGKTTRKTAQEWTCTDMRIFKVNKLYGVGMYGYCSDKYYVDFDGTLLAKMETGGDVVSFQVSKSDKIYHVPNLDYYDARGETVFSDKRMTVYEEGKGEAYTTHGQQFIFRVDFADKNMAGLEELASEMKDKDAAGGPAALYNLGLFEPLSLVVRYYDQFGVERRVNLPVVTSTVACAMQTHKNLNSAAVIGVGQQGETLAFAGNLPGFVSLKEYKLYYGNDAVELTSSQKTAYEADTKKYNESSETKIAEFRKLDNDPATKLSRVLDSVKTYYRVGMSVDKDDSRAGRIEERRKLLDMCNGAREMISITGVSLFQFDKEGLVSLSYGSNNSLDVTTTGTPMLYYASNTVDGLPLYNHCAMDLGTMMAKPKGTFSLLPKDTKEKYVIVLTTDNVPTASTSDNVKIQLTYTTTDGVLRQTDEIDTSSKVKDFYGYWPGAKNGTSESMNMSYDIGANSGNTMEFMVEIAELDQFKSIRFSLEGGGKDDWQMSQMAIYQCRDVSKRLSKWENCTGKTGTSNRVFYRSYDTTHCLALINSESSKVYLGGGSSVQMDFNSTTPVRLDDVDWNAIRDTMTYEQATQPLGFTRSRYRYQVDVKVKSNSAANDYDGDTGSANLFYFQLIFESGNSAYVLANQQLISDGFRAGQIETFFVSTNQNYGDLLEVRIIPDDSINEEKDIFDKLCIDYIEVIKDTNSGLCRTWHISDVGWIDIDYRDNNTDGQEGRTEGELARIFAVTYPTYSLNLMFAIQTGTYEENNKGQKYEQYKGTLTAELTYRTIDGNTATKSFDVVSAMYQYADREVPKDSTEKYTDSESGETLNKSNSDPKTMFREGHIDRFEIKLSDATEVLMMTLAASGNATHWKIDDVSVYQITSTGEVRINLNDEYQKTNAQDAIYVTSSTSTNGYLLVTDAQGVSAEQPIEFTNNPIDIYETDDVWISAVKRLPEADTDTLNLFVYMMQSDIRAADADPVSEYNMTASITYQRKMYDATCQVTTDYLSRPLPTYSGNQQMFYASNIKATGMSALYSLHLKSSSPSAVKAYVDYAIIQRVRSGVVVDTYYFDFGGFNADMGVSATPTDRSKYQKLEQQTVMLQMSEDTPQTTLFAESVDMAVAIEYIGTNDQLNTSHYSPYVYLTDQNIASIGPGQIVTLTFNEPYVREVVGIKLVPVGNITGTVTSACAVRYELSRGYEKDVNENPIETTVRELKGWDNFAEPLKLQRTQLKMRYTDTNVAQVELKFATGMQHMTLDSGTDGPVRMKLTYRDQFNLATETMIIPDARLYLTEGSFQTGDTAVITMLIPDLSMVRSVEVEPYNGTDGSATWSLDSVACSTTVNGETHTVNRAVGSIVHEGDPLTINLSNVSVRLRASIANPDTGVSDIRNTVNGNLDMVLLLNENDMKNNRYLNRSLELTPTVEGALDTSPNGYTFVVERLAGSEYIQIPDAELSRNTDGVITFLPKDNGLNDNVYRITVSSVENPAAKATVRMLVTRNAEAKLPELNIEITATASSGTVGDVGGVLTLDKPEANVAGKINVTVKPSIVNSIGGYDYTVCEDETQLVAGSGAGSDEFTLQLDADSTRHEYVVTVTSREDPDKAATITVVMGAVEMAVEVPVEAPAEAPAEEILTEETPTEETPTEETSTEETSTEETPEL